MLKACVCLIVLYDFGTCAASILIFGFPVSCGLGSFENALFIDGNYPVRGNGLEREKKTNIYTDFDHLPQVFKVCFFTFPLEL